jgi:hypothetical protein
MYHLWVQTKPCSSRKSLFGGYLTIGRPRWISLISTYTLVLWLSLWTSANAWSRRKRESTVLNRSIKTERLPLGRSQTSKMTSPPLSSRKEAGSGVCSTRRTLITPLIAMSLRRRSISKTRGFEELEKQAEQAKDKAKKELNALKKKVAELQKNLEENHNVATKPKRCWSAGAVISSPW